MTTLVLVFLLATICHFAYAGPGPSDSLSATVNCASADTACIASHLRMANALTNSDYPKALEHAVSAVQLSEKAENYSAMIESYKVAGGIAMYKGLFDLAVKYFTSHFDLAKSKGDDIEAGMAYHNLGAIYIAIEDYEKAKKYLNDSYEMLETSYRQTDLSLPKVTVLTYHTNMALIHINLGEYQRADSMLTLSMNMVQGMTDQTNKVMTIHSLRAMLYLKTRQPVKAFDALKVARSMAVQQHNKPAVAITYIPEGEAFEQTGDSQSAKKSYTVGLCYAEQYNGLTDMMILSEKLYKLYQKSGPSDSVVKYFNLFTDLERKLKVQQAREELMRTDLLRNYNRMVGDWERVQRATKRQHLVLSVTLLVALIAAVSVFIRYQHRNRKMRFERVRRDLEERKAELEQRRLQAELDQQSAVLENLRSELNKQQLLEGLVSGLDPAKPIGYEQVTHQQETIKGSATERKIKAWEEFEFRFQQLHSGFYDRLNQRFQGLTINERRLCAFLKLDMTTKEISDITGQSVRAVNMARIRLRNKLGITHTDTELFAFLSEL